MDIIETSVGGAVAWQAGDVLCRVALSRPAGAAATMYGCTATATAIDIHGEPLLGANGRAVSGSHTSAVPKADLVANPAAVAASVADDARRQAISALLTELAVQAANAEVGI